MWIAVCVLWLASTSHSAQLCYLTLSSSSFLSSKSCMYREQKCQSLVLVRRCHCHSVQLIYNLQVSFLTQFVYAVVCHDDPFTFVEMTPPKKAKFSVWVTVVSCVAGNNVTCALVQRCVHRRVLLFVTHCQFAISDALINHNHYMTAIRRRVSRHEAFVIHLSISGIMWT